MKNILMIHYDLHFYRVPIYNQLQKKLLERGVNLIIWPIRVLNNQSNIEFPIIEAEFTFKKFRIILNDYNIRGVINYIQPSNPGYLFYFAILSYSLYKRVDLYYYGHGLNLESESKISSIVYNILHIIYKKIILYTPNEKLLLWKRYQNKICIAYNTLDLEVPKKLSMLSKKDLKKKYNLGENDFVVLFSGRIEKRKKLSVLIKLAKKVQLEGFDNIKFVIVGPVNIKSELKEFTKLTNVIYLGAIYDKDKMSEIFSLSDIFSIPGHIGLGLVEALFWGLPVLTLNVKHAPEVFYLKNGYNGFILDSEEEIYNKIIMLYSNRKYLYKLSKHAKISYRNNANISKMMDGFLEALI